MSEPITKLYPRHEELPLEGIFLQHALHQRHQHQQPFVYTNYIASLDGRIAVADPLMSEHKVPDTITNRRDWRLYQELAAQADVLITSARYIRQLVKGSAQDVLPLGNDKAYADLHAWRRAQHLPSQPAVVILSSGNDLPLAQVYERLDRTVYVAAGEEAAKTLRGPVEKLGGKLLSAGSGKWVNGKHLIDALAGEGFRSIYSIAGPQVFKTLLDSHVLNRLYLTQVHRLIGGASYDTLLETDLGNTADLKLAELYYDS
ncbi:MAG: dihydrofolate reductase family protein, partial [Gammaproteobacteria bacterium]